MVNLLILFRKQGSCKSSEENWPDHSSAHHYSPAVPRYRVSSGMISPRNKLLIVSLFTSVLRKFNNTLCLSGNILSPLKLFFPQLRAGSKLVPKCLMRSVHTRFLCFLAATPQKLYKNTVFRIFRKGTILSGRNIMSKHFLGLGQHRAAWGSTLKS